MIWMIGGTINATEICHSLVSAGWPILVSVTTGYGRHLSEQSGAEVLQGMLTMEDMTDLVASKGIKLILDTSHPFATEVSLNAMYVAKQAGVPYLRFERQNPKFERATYVADYPEAIAILGMTEGNILLTTGSKNIGQFTSLDVERLYARVLTSSDSVALCKKAGLKPTHIIGISGVCSVALNLALLREFNIKYLVTKESGTEGGLHEKMEAAQKAGVEVIIIKRPAIEYPEVYSDYNNLIKRIEEIYR